MGRWNFEVHPWGTETQSPKLKEEPGEEPGEEEPTIALKELTGSVAAEATRRVGGVAIDSLCPGSKKMARSPERVLGI